MKQIFFDKNQLVFIKVFTSSLLTERELYGARVFSKFVHVPQIERLDAKVAKISLISGFLGYQISEIDLNRLVVKFLMAKNSAVNAREFYIFEEIKVMRLKFKENQKLLGILSEIEQGIIGLPLYPVHGDLQKQNIIITGGRLGLIDFEHFMIAPKELEFCNSLFFEDGNCLNIKAIAAFLPRKLFNKQILKKMLKFYALRQQISGMNEIEAEARLSQALIRADNLRFGRKQPFKGGLVESSSFCYI